MISEVRELNNQKFACLQEIFELTIKQKEVLAKEDFEGLQKLINSKQGLINKVNQINARLENLDENAKELSTEIEELAKKAYQVDRENLGSANKILFKIKQKVGNVRKGKKVHQAYNPTMSQAVFFNKSR